VVRKGKRHLHSRRFGMHERRTWKEMPGKRCGYAGSDRLAAKHHSLRWMTNRAGVL